MKGHWDPVKGHPWATPLPSMPPSPNLAPHYSDVELVGIPPRPHFRIIDEPDACTAAGNSNGWSLLHDEELLSSGLWSPAMITKWAETTTAVSTPIEINESMHGYNKMASQKQFDDDDAESGYLYEDHVELKDLQHYHCDIDTRTGRLLPPLKHPRTLPALSRETDGVEPVHKHRTSEDVIMQKVSRKVKGSKPSSPQKAYQDAILAVEEDLRRRPLKPVTGHLYPVPEGLIFRPAFPGDMEAVAEIYNAEVMGTGMAPDSAAVPTNTYRQILQTCQNNKKPFIIAVKNANRLADISKWPDGIALEDWLRLKKAQGEPVGREEVVGFALLSAFDYGIWANEGNAQRSARIRCFVSPEHRRRGIGRALVDLMLQMTITGYTAKCDTKWAYDRPNKVFSRTAFENEKKYHRIFIEVYFKNGGDPTVEGLQALLENQFGFTPMGHILGAYMTERGQESVWLDKYIWGMDAQHQDDVGWYEGDVRETQFQ